MNNYELTVVLPGESASSKVKSFSALLEKIITGLKGKITSTKEWRKIELSYPIKKNKSGLFLHYNLELEASSVKAINDKFKLDEDIIRSLIVKSSK